MTPRLDIEQVPDLTEIFVVLIMVWEHTVEVVCSHVPCLVQKFPCCSKKPLETLDLNSR